MGIAHGTILGGLSVVPDLDAALINYRDVLTLDLLHTGQLSVDLANSWGTPGSAGARYAVLRPRSGSPCWFRVVEQPDHPQFKPTTTYGWGAFECTAEDVFGWPERLAGSMFDIVGYPRKLPGMDAFVPMQVLGTGREMVYLNEVFGNMTNTDLPRAKSLTDHIFIVILGAPDRRAACAWYQDRLGLELGDTYEIPYQMINTAFGLPSDHITAMTMMQSARMPVIEVDDYPAIATRRACHPGMLPPGNALVTLAVSDLAACEVDWIMPPELRNGALYEGRRAAATIGPAGELLELVEVC
jgi:catechol 2,3-dioxygenase-like lactoylglutathione lyase family enzyme